MIAKILLVEDNPLTAKGLTYLFEREQYEVKVATNASLANKLLLSEYFDLILLDVSLPDRDGFTVVENLCHHFLKTPFIFITARDEEADVIRGLELGAEDYITKPFHSRELLLRVRNSLNRSGKATTKLTIGQFSLDPVSGAVLMDGKNLTLTALELRLLSCLMENAGRVVTRERLLDEIWDASGRAVNDNTLSVYLKRLREKLGRAEVIETIKNVGYRFNASEEQA